MKKKLIFLLPLLLFTFISKVNAVSGTVGYSGTSLYVGESKNITIIISNPDTVQAIGGSIASADSSCIKINSIDPANDNTEINGNHFAYVGMRNVSSGLKIVSVNITGLKECNSSLSLSNVKVSGQVDSTAVDSSAIVSAGTITVKEKEVVQQTTPTETTPSENPKTNNSSNESSSSNSSSSNTTSNNTSSSNSSSSNNNSSSNSNKNTTVKKDGSKDNNLSSLTVDGYELKFDKNTTSYNIDVKYDVTEVKVNAKAQDNKASVSISGDKDLKYGNNNVKIVVTAENGDKKTYTIVVKREVDPNKELKNINTLSNLVTNVGFMSPKFSSDVLDYIIYLPYEIDEIKIDATLTDESSTLEKEEIEKLEVGDNIFKYNVRAENGDIKTYTVRVRRASKYSSVSNTYLKSITINGGTLLFENGSKVDNFDKEIRKYFYSKENGFSYSAEPEDENSVVKVFEKDGVISFVVEAPNGDFSVYTLQEYKFTSSTGFKVIIALVSFIAGFAGCYGIYCFYKKKRKKKKVEVSSN